MNKLFTQITWSISCVSAVRVSATIPNWNNVTVVSHFANNPGEVPLTGSFQTCFTVQLNVGGTNFKVQVDTGSSDLAVPNKGLNSYAGPTLNLAANNKLVQATYGSGSWSGYAYNGVVSLTNSVSANNAPFAAMMKQTNMADGVKIQGILGVAYDSISTLGTTPRTVMDAWYQAGVLQNNEIAFHACPSNLMSQAYIDFGNSDPSFSCNPSGSPYVWAESPSTNYYTINVLDILIGGSSAPVPSTFQEAQLSDGSQSWTVVDSCTSILLLPDSVVQALVTKILNSGAVPSNWPQSTINSFFNVESVVSNPGFNWAKFPTLSFVIDSGTGSNFQITLSANEYIQQTANGQYQFLVLSGNDYMAILGIPLFTGLDIVFDRANTRVGFSLGCGCSTSTSKFPDIVSNQGSAWNNIGGSSLTANTTTPAGSINGTKSNNLNQTNSETGVKKTSLFLETLLSFLASIMIF